MIDKLPITEIDKWRIYRTNKKDMTYVFGYDNHINYQFLYCNNENKFHHVYYKNHSMEGITCDVN